MTQIDENIETIILDIEDIKSLIPSRNHETRFNDRVLQYFSDYKSLIDAALDAVIAMPNDEVEKLKKEYGLYSSGLLYSNDQHIEFFEERKDEINTIMKYGNDKKAKEFRLGKLHEYSFEQLSRALKYALYGKVDLQHDDIEIESPFERRLNKQAKFTPYEKGYNAEIHVSGGTTRENFKDFQDLNIDGERLGIKLMLACRVYPSGYQVNRPRPNRASTTHLFVPNESMTEFRTTLDQAGYQIE